mgnify:CR=1 FL=1
MAKKQKMVKITVYMPKYLVEYIDKRRKELGMTRNDFIVMVLNDYMNSRKNDKIGE